MYPAAATSEQHTCGATDVLSSYNALCKCGTLSSHPGDSQCKFRTDDSICGTGSGEGDYGFFAQNSEKHYSLILLPASVDQNLY